KVHIAFHACFALSVGGTESTKTCRRQKGYLERTHPEGAHLLLTRTSGRRDESVERLLPSHEPRELAFRLARSLRRYSESQGAQMAAVYCEGPVWLLAPSILCRMSRSSLDRRRGSGCRTP